MKSTTTSLPTTLTSTSAPCTGMGMTPTASPTAPTGTTTTASLMAVIRMASLTPRTSPLPTTSDPCTGMVVIPMASLTASPTAPTASLTATTDVLIHFGSLNICDNEFIFKSRPHHNCIYTSLVRANKLLYNYTT